MGIAEHALLSTLQHREPLLWLNPAVAPALRILEELHSEYGIGLQDIEKADRLLRRWSNALTRLFPELADAEGIIESPLLPLEHASTVTGAHLAGRFLIKADHALPVAGSIKARGGIFEVLTHAQALAARAGLFREGDDPLVLLRPDAQAFFAQYSVSVGSTGNLGLSIGVMASALGFRASVHMSSEAKDWKKLRLRNRGVTVIEHSGDYALAVAAGRDQADADPKGYFVDDENSRHLFLGYAVAALRLREQLAAAGIAVNASHPLFVYLPCGVGGAPGGITFGLKHVFGDAVHCFFGEPAASPAMLVRALSGERRRSVYDIGLDNLTEADGLAVGEASELVYQLIRNLFAGEYTVEDKDLFRVVYRLKEATGIQIEPSAAAAFLGIRFFEEAAGRRYLQAATHGAGQATHIFWTTGGSLVPQSEHARFYQHGRDLAAG